VGSLLAQPTKSTGTSQDEKTTTYLIHILEYIAGIQLLAYGMASLVPQIVKSKAAVNVGAGRRQRKRPREKAKPILHDPTGYCSDKHVLYPWWKRELCFMWIFSRKRTRQVTLCYRTLPFLTDPAPATLSPRAPTQTANDGLTTMTREIKGRCIFYDRLDSVIYFRGNNNNDYTVQNRANENFNASHFPPQTQRP